MAVFTELSQEDVADILTRYDLGEFLRLEPISEGIENTNYFVHTSLGIWVLTVFERLNETQIPYYLSLAEHLKQKGCAVAAPVRNHEHALFGMIHGKPYVFNNCLEGKSVTHPTVAECRKLGEALAKMHLAVSDFPMSQPNLRGPQWWTPMAEKLLPYIDQEKGAFLMQTVRDLQPLFDGSDFNSLPNGACHCDLFRNNVMILNHGEENAEISGVFDFYFAGNVPFAFDLAVTINDWCLSEDGTTLDVALVKSLMDSYSAVRRLTLLEHRHWREFMRAASLRFWVSRLFDYYMPREASLLTPHDPTHFERILKDRTTAPLYWPDNADKDPNVSLVTD